MTTEYVIIVRQTGEPTRTTGVIYETLEEAESVVGRMRARVEDLRPFLNGREYDVAPITMASTTGSATAGSAE